MEQSTVDYYALPLPICQLDQISLDKTLLWVIHADKTPVHLGISSNGSYFSLKKNGKDEHLSIEILQELLTRKQIPTLVFLFVQRTRRRSRRRRRRVSDMLHE